MQVCEPYSGKSGFPAKLVRDIGHTIGNFEDSLFGIEPDRDLFFH